MQDKRDVRLVELTARLVGAYVGAQPLPRSELTELIRDVHARLDQLKKPSPAAPVPAVPVNSSIHPDYLVCLEDGLRFRTLKRHLAVSHGMTPDQYRAKWNLPASYPMVAPNYSRLRSSVARRIGLGGKNTPD
ncbi:MAG: MucR family transcriptional regulator [Aliihoeflea sp.]|jgi:predicted transcriptional regulator